MKLIMLATVATVLMSSGAASTTGDFGGDGDPNVVVKTDSTYKSLQCSSAGTAAGKERKCQVLARGSEIMKATCRCQLPLEKQTKAARKGACAAAHGLNPGGDLSAVWVDTGLGQCQQKSCTGHCQTEWQTWKDAPGSHTNANNAPALDGYVALANAGPCRDRNGREPSFCQMKPTPNLQACADYCTQVESAGGAGACEFFQYFGNFKGTFKEGARGDCLLYTTDTCPKHNVQSRVKAKGLVWNEDDQSGGCDNDKLVASESWWQVYKQAENAPVASWRTCCSYSGAEAPNPNADGDWCDTN